jgi:DNA-binding response OmpR family regulator
MEDKFMRLLVIEDDPEIRTMICRMLPTEQYEVMEAANGRDALFLLHEKNDFDLVITDILMPEKEGLETILELKRNFRHIKILAMSGGGLGSAQDYLTMAKELGADGTLKKPFIKDELLSAVDNIMKRELLKTT